MYLTRDTVRVTFANIARRSAKNSTLIVNYHSPYRSFFGKLMLRLTGEPHRSAWQPDAMAKDLRDAGFEVSSDSNMAEWNNEYAGGEANVERARYMRIAVARRIT